MSTRPSGEPLPGVVSPALSVAARRVAKRLHGETRDLAESELVASLLAAIALAVDRRQTDFVSSLFPRPSPVLGHRLVEELRAELLETWAQGRSTTPPSVILDALAGLEQVRHALPAQAQAEESLAKGFSGPDALELFVEVVHDLRSPITSILFLAETLQHARSGPVTQLQARQLGLIYSAALGLSGVVGDALELAQDGGELTDSEPSPCSLAELLEAVTDIVRPMTEEKGLYIRHSSIEPDARLGHPLALSRVLLNLTTNAIKFTERGGVEISCTAPGPSPRVRFAVQDTGPGISPTALASLYQPFRRARGRPGYCFSGTGLGLAICRKLVPLMGSELQLETGTWGTKFFFELDLPVVSRR